MIPELDQSGNLPPGIHRATWWEVEERYGCTPYRRRLLAGLKLLLQNLAAAGCTTFYLDGSFVSDKSIPGDFDGCWVQNGVDPFKVDPLLLKQRLAPGEDWKSSMKRKYRGEVYPITWDQVAMPDHSMLELFQTDRVTWEKKGIVEIDLRGWPCD